QQLDSASLLKSRSQPVGYPLYLTVPYLTVPYLTVPYLTVPYLTVVVVASAKDGNGNSRPDRRLILVPSALAPVQGLVHALVAAKKQAEAKIVLRPLGLAHHLPVSRLRLTRRRQTELIEQFSCQPRRASFFLFKRPDGSDRFLDFFLPFQHLGLQ